MEPQIKVGEFTMVGAVDVNTPTNTAPAPSPEPSTPQSIPEVPAVPETPAIVNDTPAVDPVVAPDPAATSNPSHVSPSFDDIFREKSGGKTWEDYNKDIEELKTKAKAASLLEKFKEEDISKLEGILKEGLTMEKLKSIAEINLMNPDAMTNQEALRKKLSMVDGLSPEEIEAEMLQYDSGYSPEEISMLETKDRIRIAGMNAKFEREAREAKAKLNSLKADAKLPELKSSAPSAEQLKQAEEQQRQQIEQWKGNVKSSLSDYNKEVFEIDKDTRFEFVITDEVKQKAQSSMEDIVGFYNRYMQDGKVNYAQLRREQAILNNLDGFVKSVYKQAEAKAKEGLVKEMNNVDFTPGATAPAEGGKPLTYEQQLSAHAKAEWEKFKS